MDRGSCRRNSARGETLGNRFPIRSTGKLRKCSSAPGRRIRTEPPSSPAPSSFLLRGAALETTLWLMCETGRCRVRTAVGERPVDPIRWDSGSPWQLRLQVTPGEPGQLSVTAMLVRDDQQMTLDEPDLMHSGRLLIAHGAIAPFDDAGAGALVSLFRAKKVISIGEDELPAFLAAMYALPHVPAIDLPPRQPSVLE